MKILVTGTAGFIGFTVATQLLRSGHEVYGVDCITPYYDPALKMDRQRLLLTDRNFTASKTNIVDRDQLRVDFTNFQPEVVIHLAAQAGVRHSIDFPQEYLDTNIIGTFNVLELAREFDVAHSLMASTSSVYGENPNTPFTEDMKCDTPKSFYAATKLADEHMARSYSHIYDMRITMLRFFTVYGPWGRPDLALFKFVKAMLAGKPIDIYNHGNMNRDFTYVEDVATAVHLLINKIPQPYRVVNIGNGNAVPLMEFIKAAEAAIDCKAEYNFMPMQPGDVQGTLADTSLLLALTRYRPDTDYRLGIREFVKWYKGYYRV